MAYAQTARTLDVSRVTDKLSALVAELRLAMARRAVYRRTLEELYSLTDRELTDLGMSRTSLRAIALQAAYGA